MSNPEGAVVNLCEYCNRDALPAFGWHSDVWCLPCAEEAVLRVSFLTLEGTFAEAPVLTREEHYAAYEAGIEYGGPRPYVLGFDAARGNHKLAAKLLDHSTQHEPEEQE